MKAADVKSETAEQQQADRDRAYNAGAAAVAQRILSAVLPVLHPAEVTAVRLAKERAQTVAALREVCTDHGDNDWPDDLSLADVVEKHLARHLCHGDG